MSGLVGRWSGEEDVSATAWTAAGRARGELTIVSGPGGLIVDYAETRADGAMVGHGVVAGDGWWWFDSYGFVPHVPGTATWDDGVLTLERRSERGRNVMTLSADDGRLTMRLSAASPADGDLRQLVVGAYVRAGEPDAR